MDASKTNFISSLFALCFYLLFVVCSGEIYSSVVHIEESVAASKKLTENLMTLAKRENIHIPNIHRVYRELKGKSEQIRKNPESLISHPVRIFRFVNRLHQFFVDTFQSAFQRSYAENLNEDLPTWNDRTGIISGLLRLQESYNQSTAQVSRGIIAGVDSVNLTADECYDIGQVALEQDKQTLGLEWLKEAWNRIPLNERGNYIYFAENLANLAAMSGSIGEAIKYAEEGLLADPSQHEMFEKYIRLNESCHKMKENPKVIMNPIDLNFSRLCADENWVNPDWQTLNCYITDEGHPILKLQPIRVEEVKRNPDVVVFHDFITDYEIEKIKLLTKSKLERSTIRVSETEQIPKETRVSKGVFLKTKEATVIRLKDRVAAATGLGVRRGSEPLQVVNYGVGGFYTHHIDAWHQTDKNMEQDNRVATVLMYLSDVPAGGATVFPRIELRIKAEKGALAFWYNLYKNLHVNLFTRHAACPVMVGSKWVANFWIHRYYNEFTTKCPLDKNTFY